MNKLHKTMTARRIRALIKARDEPLTVVGRRFGVGL